MDTLSSSFDKTSRIGRHADKGGWTIDMDQFAKEVPDESDRVLIMSVLKHDFPGMLESGKTPLKLEGMVRSLRMGETLFNSLPSRCVLAVIDSGKDRAQLTRALATAKIEQLEAKQPKGEQEVSRKRVDMLLVQEPELMKLLADANEATWGPYDDMMAKEGVSEKEAIYRWLVDMNKPDSGVSPDVAPQEAAERYRRLNRLMHGEETGITSDQVPVIMFGVGHSGSLGQARYEAGDMTEEDTPGFCEMFQFDKQGQVKGSQKVEL